MKKKSLAVVVLTVLVVAISFGFSHINSLSFSSELQPKDSVTVASVVKKQEWLALYDSLHLNRLGLSEQAFHCAWYGFQKMKLKQPIVAIADFSQSSRSKRLYIIDLINHKLLYNTYVAHGKNSGQEFAEHFSNQDSSNQSSLGFYRTLGTYQGKHGLSLKLEGVEKGINDHAFDRAIVMHAADYVSEAFIRQTGHLGRSLGCPAISYADHEKVINLLKNGAGLFLYSPENNYLKKSSLLAGVSTSGNNQASHPYTSL
ncbi:MAG: murein L,D-transpeptidase catalytic domain family protein [Siphonobacter sp.]